MLKFVVFVFKVNIFNYIVFREVSTRYLSNYVVLNNIQLLILKNYKQFIGKFL